MATVFLHLAHLERSRGPMDGAVMRVEYEERQADVVITGITPAIADAAPYGELRTELRRLSRALETAPIVETERTTGSILLQGRSPYELISQRQPKAHHEGDVVVVTVPAFAAGFPEATADIQVRLKLEHAAPLVEHLQTAIAAACKQLGA
jgi:hypothetical protein